MRLTKSVLTQLMNIIHAYKVFTPKDVYVLGPIVGIIQFQNGFTEEDLKDAAKAVGGINHIIVTYCETGIVTYVVMLKDRLFYWNTSSKADILNMSRFIRCTRNELRNFGMILDNRSKREKQLISEAYSYFEYLVDQYCEAAPFEQATVPFHAESFHVVPLHLQRCMGGWFTHKFKQVKPDMVNRVIMAYLTKIHNY